MNGKVLTFHMNLFNESIEVPLIVFELLFMAKANVNAMLYDAPFTTTTLERSGVGGSSPAGRCFFLLLSFLTFRHGKS